MTHFGFPGFLFFSPLASSEPWPQEVTQMYFRNLKRSQPLPPRPSRCCNGFFFGLAISNNLLVSLLLWSMWHFKCELFTHYIWFCNILCSCAACVFFRSETSPPWFSADVSICLDWPKCDDTFLSKEVLCDSVNRLQSPSHFLQEFPRQQAPPGSRPADCRCHPRLIFSQFFNRLWSSKRIWWSSLSWSKSFKWTLIIQSKRR